MYCSECGKKIDDNVKYCPECGAAVASKVKVKPTPVYIVSKKSALEHDTIAITKAPKDLLTLGILAILDVVIMITFITIQNIAGSLSAEAARGIEIFLIILGCGIEIPGLVFLIKLFVKTNCINKHIKNNKKLYLTTLILPYTLSAFAIIMAIIAAVVTGSAAFGIIVLVLECISFALMIYMSIYCFVTYKTIKQYLIKEKLI